MSASEEVPCVKVETALSVTVERVCVRCLCVCTGTM